MKILGIGVDIVSVERIRTIHERFPEPFPRKLLSASELLDLSGTEDPVGFLARRFAAKEAVAKALGTGIGAGLGLTDISIGHDALGRPEIALDPLTPWAHQDLEFHISISDERQYAVAYVLALRP